MLLNGKVFYAGSMTKFKTYNDCNISPFATQSYADIYPVGPTFTSTSIAFFTEYSYETEIPTCMRFNPNPVFNCDTTCTGTNKIITGDNAGAAWVINSSTAFTLSATPLAGPNFSMTVPGSWESTQTRDWC